MHYEESFADQIWIMYNVSRRKHRTLHRQEIQRNSLFFLWLDAVNESYDSLTILVWLFRGSEMTLSFLSNMNHLNLIKCNCFSDN